MITTCPICGKSFDVLWPQLWRYKRARSTSTKYFCTWTCLRAFDKGKEAKKVSTIKRSRLQIAEKICELISQGEDPKAYLTELGYGNPGQAYSDIRKLMKVSRPDLFARLPENLRSWRAVNINGAEPKQPRKMKIETPETVVIPVKPEQVFPKAETPEKPADGGDTSCRVTALDTPIGEFHYDKRNQYIDWDWDNNTMSLNLEEWKEFKKWFPYALKRLGVEL